MAYVQGTGIVGSLAKGGAYGPDGDSTSTYANNLASDVALANKQLAEMTVLYDGFTDLYLGVKASDPTLDNDGEALDVGALYYNSSIQVLRAWDGFVWNSVTGAGGAVGSFGNAAFFENDNTVTHSYTITAGKNAMSGGPMAVGGGVVVTVPVGSTWTVV
jgi:hypothetical protein